MKPIVSRWVLVGTALAGVPLPARGDDTKTLPIPARDQAKEAPAEGWCGETAIQEGLLFIGVWAPQSAINKAGKPTHPDLYSQDLPIALAELGVRFTPYVPRVAGYAGYAKWAREAVDAGRPIVAGVKILPTKHPEWGLDHFVTIVGYGEQGLLVNTTWGTRVWASDTTAEGISFVRAGYGLRFDGLVDTPAGASPARASFVEETDAGIKLHVVCTGTPPTAQRLEMREKRGQAAPSRTLPGPEADVLVDPTKQARFRCTPTP